MVEETKQEVLASWDEAQSSSFVEFIDGERHTYAVKDWKLVKVQKPSYDDKTKLVDMIEFRCDVVAIDGKQAKAKIGTTSKRFIAGVRQFLEKATPGSIVFLSIKRIGKDNATNYDVEFREPTPVA